MYIYIYIYIYDIKILGGYTNDKWKSFFIFLSIHNLSNMIRVYNDTN